MMAYQISCRGCSRKVRIAGALVERVAKCPNCERKFVLHRGKPKANGAPVKAPPEDIEVAAEEDAEDLALASLLADDEIPDVKPKKPQTDHEPVWQKTVSMEGAKKPSPAMYIPPPPPPPTMAKPPMKKPAAKEEGEGIPPKIKALVGVGGGLIALILVGWFLFGGSALGDVSGTVTLDNQPVSGAQITFMGDDVKQADDPSQLGTYAGRSDDKGHYKIHGHTGSGIPSGKYRVLVTKFVATKRKAAPAGAEGAEVDPETENARNALPGTYETFDSTNLKFEVGRGRNSIDLKLTK